MRQKIIRDKYYCLNCSREIPWKGCQYHHKYCSNKCQMESKVKRIHEKNKSLFNEGKLKRHRFIKRFLRERDGNKCSICGQEPMHNDEPLVMVLDHIDGNAANNDPSNFRLVCPNCDSQLPTFKGRNMGNGRASHGMKWYEQ